MSVSALQVIQQHAIYLGPAPAIMAHRKRKPFAAYFFTRNILHCTVFTAEAYTGIAFTPETYAFYTRAFLIIAQAFYTGNNLTPATLPHQKQKFFWRSSFVTRNPWYIHTAAQTLILAWPAIACMRKYNISLSGNVLRMHFVRDVLQERKCDIAPVTLNAPMPQNRCTCHEEWHTNTTKECTCHEK